MGRNIRKTIERAIRPRVTSSWRLCAAIVAGVSSTAAIPSISEQARAALDRTLGVKGVYLSEESAYKFTFPRTDVSLRVAGQRLSPTQAPKSWATFSPSMHREAMVIGELALLEDEVNSVISAALKSGLLVTGLGPTLLSEVPRVLALNVTGEGEFQGLAGALRKTLDEVRRVRAEKRDASARPGPATAPVHNAIDAAPVNEILSMRGAATDGVYRAAIGRVALMNDTPIGREMGMSTTISMFGTNDRAFVDAEMIVHADELQRVLMALRARNLNITSIRNHIVGEHPQSIFVRVWGQGAALDLAKRFRYALDVEVGAVR
jgi:hypothetical protein